MGHDVSREGFEAEWRGIDLLTVDGDMVNRGEIFDEADLDTAIATFEELSNPAPTLENAASRITARLQAHFAARDWTAMTKMLAYDVFSDDRRRVVSAEIRYGRDATIRDAQANADLGLGDITSSVIATRGERLVLRRARYSGEAFHTISSAFSKLVAMTGSWHSLCSTSTTLTPQSRNSIVGTSRAKRHRTRTPGRSS